ncbi:MAG: hypothetical protein U5M50_04145 [Sphingobium sp.]|nr:hypothetical protein [Sphingobium sp.]
MAVQFIKSARKGKPISWYVYAYKGGPLILKAQQPTRPKLTARDWAKVAEAEEAQRALPTHLLRYHLRQYRSLDPDKPSSPEWDRLADSTKELWGAHLDLIDNRWGHQPVSVWNDPRMVAKVVKWRDERVSAPRAADIGVTVLKALLEYLRLRGVVAINVAANIPRLYKGGNRADIIWSDADMEAFRAAAVKKGWPQVHDGLMLAALTGLRRADLVTLTWDQIGQFAIVKTALKKSQGKRRKAVIPMTEKLETLLADLRGRPRLPGVETVLTNSYGRPWTKLGFGASFSFIRDMANIVHVEEGDDGKSIERKKHLHDVRGTFCTMLLIDCDLTDREAGEIMAWSPERVGKIRSTYVDRNRVVVALGNRIGAKQKAKQSGTAQ